MRGTGAEMMTVKVIMTMIKSTIPKMALFWGERPLILTLSFWSFRQVSPTVLAECLISFLL